MQYSPNDVGRGATGEDPERVRLEPPRTELPAIGLPAAPSGILAPAIPVLEAPRRPAAERTNGEERQQAASRPAVEAPPGPAPSPAAPQPAAAAAAPLNVSGPVLLKPVLPVLRSDLRRLLTTEVTVEVRVAIDADGNVTDAQFLRANGPFSRMLLPAVLTAARQHRFKPATVRNANVPSQSILTFRFVR
jgi:TonB family protein